MIDFIRSLHTGIGAFFGALVFVWMTRWLVFQFFLPSNTDEHEKMTDMVNKVTKVAFTVIVVSFGVYVLFFASVNETPRSVIDRSSVNSQIKEFEQRINPKP